MLSAAIVIASYEPDFARCQFLIESIDLFSRNKIKIYIITPTDNVVLFSNIKSSNNIEIIDESAILPWWLFPIPFSKKWRFSLFTIPLRGWIIQQMCKLNICAFANEDFYIILDSDNVFVRPWSVSDFINEESQVRLLSVPGRGQNLPGHNYWHKIAGQLLGLEKKNYYGSGYIGNVITWRRDTLLKLQERVGKNSLFGWQHAIARNITVSEYILYGIFSEHVLKDESGHYTECQNIVLEYWDEKELNDDEIYEFLNKLEPEHLAVMITAKAGIPVDRYESKIRKLWNTYGNCIDHR